MSWQPAHEAHAIERVSMMLQFKEAVGTKLWQALINRATIQYQQTGFNAISEGVGFNFSASGIGGENGPREVRFQPLALPNMPGLGARHYRKVVENVVAEEVILSQTHFIFAVTRYDRWAQFKARAFELLMTAIEQILQVVDIQLFKLEYWDRFTFIDTEHPTDYRQLFKSDSDHVPTFAYTASDLWHSHSGYFVTTQTPTKRLININIDIFDGEEKGKVCRSAGVYSMAQDTALTDKSLQTKDIEVILDGMHENLTDLIKNVIHSDLLARIGLGEAVK